MAGAIWQGRELDSRFLHEQGTEDRHCPLRLSLCVGGVEGRGIVRKVRKWG